MHVEPADATPEPVRAIWVVRDALADTTLTPEALPFEARRMGANTLFVQVSGRGDAYYPSERLPRAEALLPEAGDPVARLLMAAREYGLAVHAWINVGLVWSAPEPPEDPTHVWHAHPEWLQALPGGVPMRSLPPDSLHAWWVEGVFAELTNPDYRAHVGAVVEELLERYAFDGIHLDYIRRPILDTGYDAATWARFEAEAGRVASPPAPADPAGVAALRVHRWPDYSDSASAGVDPAWNAFRRRGVTEAVRAVRDVLEAAEARSGRPLALSAAVIPDPERALRRFAQPWPEWLNAGLVDFVVPMCYRAGREEARAQLLAVLEVAEPDRVLAGLGAYQQPLGEAALTIRRMMEHPVLGVCVFSWQALLPRLPDGAALLERAWTPPEWTEGRGTTP